MEDYAMNKQLATLDEFFRQISSTPDNALVFVTDDGEISPDYHVTEVKQSTVHSIDCGRNLDQWGELLVQLLDGPKGGAGQYMHADKFIQIVKSAVHHLPDAEDSELIFEFAPDNAPMCKLVVRAVENKNGHTIVALSDKSAECKAGQRWIGKNEHTSPCCA